jgi:hypothetical protein
MNPALSGDELDAYDSQFVPADDMQTYASD